jgi:hypothetical protein
MSMASSLTIVDSGEYLLAEFSGEFSIEAAKHCIDSMKNASIEKHQSKVLLDCRKMSGPMPITDRFVVAAYAATTRTAIAKLAMLNRPDVILPDNFVENVAVNRGANVKVFTDFEKAVRWLLV